MEPAKDYCRDVISMSLTGEKYYSYSVFPEGGADGAGGEKKVWR